MLSFLFAETLREKLKPTNNCCLEEVWGVEAAAGAFLEDRATELYEFGPHNSVVHSIPLSTCLKLSWSPEPNPFITINTDGSASPNPGSIGLGGVFRDSSGSWVLGFSKFIPWGTNLFAELLAIKEGLDLAAKRRFQYVTIQSDSQVAVNMIINENYETYLSIVSDCRKLISTFQIYKIKHIYREQNIIADCLVKQGRTEEHQILQEFNIPPPDLVRLLDEDRKGNLRIRMVSAGKM